jgi:hypothetical protein
MHKKFHAEILYKVKAAFLTQEDNPTILKK